MTVIGRVEYIADIDGKKLPASARKIGRTAGGEMGKAASKAYNSEFDDALTKYAQKFTSRMRANGTLSGQSFSDAMRRIVNSGLDDLVNDMAEVFGKKGGIEAFAARLGDAGDATDKLRANVERLNSENRITTAQYKMLLGQIDTYSEGVMNLRRTTSEMSAEQSKFDLVSSKLGRTLDDLANNKMAAANAAAMENLQFNQALDAEYRKLIELGEGRQRQLDEEDDALIRASESTDRMRSSSDKIKGSLDSQSAGWKNLSANTRQWILIGTAIAASAEEISVLGSAAGSSLTVLAGAFLAVGSGAAIAIAGFAGLYEEGRVLTEAAQGVKDAFGGLGTTFNDLQTTIVASMFGPQVQTAIEGFSTALVSLQGPIGAFALEVGNSLAAIFTALSSDEAIATFTALLDGLGPVFSSLTSAGIIFGEALGNVFELSLPYVQIFADWLGKIAQQFLDFTIANADSITEWFENGLTIMTALGPLVGAVAEALNQLVTPETVAMTVEFIEGLTEFVPILGKILGVIGELDLLNIFVQLLLAIGLAIEPLIPAFTDFAASISDSLMYAISALAPVLVTLFEALAPLLPVIAQLFAAFLATAIEAIIPLADVIVNQLIPALLPLFQALIPLLPSFVQLGIVIGENLAGAIIALMPIIIPLIETFLQLIIALEPILPVITLLIQSGLGPLIAIVQIAASFIGILISVVNMIIKPFVDMGKQVLEAAGGVEKMSELIGDSIQMFRDWGGAVDDVIQTVIGAIQDALGWFADLFGAAGRAGDTAPASGRGGNSGGGGGGFAAGGIAAYGARRLTGEAGREAIVPLQRPLAAVDPSVRTLAAFAQGKLGAMGTGGAGKSVVFSEGAIIVQTVSPDGRLIAEAVVDRIAADADI